MVGATIGTGAASSFSQVLGARTLTGVGQAFGNPASYTILGKLYPEEQRATVNGLFASSVYFGGGLAALSVLLDDALGWRALHVLIGGLGIGAACVARASIPPLSASTLDAGGDEEAGERRPLRRPSDGETENDGGAAAAAGSAEESLAALRALLAEPTVALLLLASTFRFLAGFTIGVWIVPFYRQAFPGSIGAEFALIKAAVNGVAGSASATGGGFSRTARGARPPPAARRAGARSLLAIPCWLGTIDAPTELSLGALPRVPLRRVLVWLTVAALQAAAAQRRRLTTGVFSCLTFVGNLAPFVVGLALQSGEYSSHSPHVFRACPLRRIRRHVRLRGAGAAPAAAPAGVERAESRGYRSHTRARVRTQSQRGATCATREHAAGEERATWVRHGYVV